MKGGARSNTSKRNRQWSGDSYAVIQETADSPAQRIWRAPSRADRAWFSCDLTCRVFSSFSWTPPPCGRPEIALIEVPGVLGATCPVRRQTRTLAMFGVYTSYIFHVLS